MKNEKRLSTVLQCLYLLALVLIVISCSREVKDYDRCLERCRYRYMYCADGCPKDSINFSFDFSTGFYSCQDRCDSVRNRCMESCSVLGK